MATIITLQQVEKLSKTYREQGKKIVVAGGCFDVLHIGHITLLENAKKEGDILMVFVESDASVKKRKGINRPIHAQLDRAKLVGALSCVDVVILLKERMLHKDYDILMQKIAPTIIATTDTDEYIVHKKRQAQLVGAKVVKVNTYLPYVSTSSLLKALSKEL